MNTGSKIIINNEIVFEGNIKKIGGGGTKSAYSLIGTSKVVLLPNEIDGYWLEREFDRIRSEELTIYKYLKSKSILSLKIKLCDVFINGKHKLGIYSPSFESYIDKGAYVLDLKNPLSCCWDNEIEFNKTFFDLESWIPILKPLINDLHNASENGLQFVPYYDNFNLIITKKGGSYHIGESDYAVRFFGFDFTSKRSPSSLIQQIQEGKELEKQECLIDIHTIIYILFDYIIKYENMTDEIKLFRQNLIAYLKNVFEKCI